MSLFVSTNVSSLNASRQLLTSLLEAISIVDVKRTDLGAIQNRCQSTNRHLCNI
jgi:flagellin-like hook-associated protein FlgL